MCFVKAVLEGTEKQVNKAFHSCFCIWGTDAHEKSCRKDVPVRTVACIWAPALTQQWQHSARHAATGAAQIGGWMTRFNSHHHFQTCCNTIDKIVCAFWHVQLFICFESQCQVEFVFCCTSKGMLAAGNETIALCGTLCHFRIVCRSHILDKIRFSSVCLHHIFACSQLSQDCNACPMNVNQLSLTKAWQFWQPAKNGDETNVWQPSVQTWKTDWHPPFELFVLFWSVHSSVWSLSVVCHWMMLCFVSLANAGGLTCKDGSNVSSLSKTSCLCLTKVSVMQPTAQWHFCSSSLTFHKKTNWSVVVLDCGKQWPSFLTIVVFVFLWGPGERRQRWSMPEQSACHWWDNTCWLSFSCNSMILCCCWWWWWSRRKSCFVATHPGHCYSKDETLVDAHAFFACRRTILSYQK